MNKVFMIGNLARDPELRTTNSGINCCKFTLAVSRKYKDANGNKVTDFFDVIAWRQLADICGKFLTKGKKVCVGGELQTRQYEDRNGNKRTAYELNAEDVEFLSSAGESASGTRQSEPTPPPDRKSAKTEAQKMQQQPSFTEVEDEDLPF